MTMFGRKRNQCTPWTNLLADVSVDVLGPRDVIMKIYLEHRGPFVHLEGLDEDSSTASRPRRDIL